MSQKGSPKRFLLYPPLGVGKSSMMEAKRPKEVQSTQVVLKALSFVVLGDVKPVSQC